MNSREQTLAFVLIGLICVAVAGAGGYFFILEPYWRAQTTQDTLNQEINDLEKQVEAQKQTTRRLAVARIRSLPADPTLAKREYTVALERLIEAAGVPKGYTVNGKSVDNSSRNVPELSKGKPIYSRVASELVLKKVDMWMLKDLLESYYRLGLLHQITAINIKKDDDPNAKNANRRNDLTVTLTTEAIIVDGAENRRTLVRVPTAFAAVGGGAIYKGLALTPEAARGVHAQELVPTLSPVNRDYRLIVKKDPFHGPLPDPIISPFKLAKISDVKIKTDEKPSPVHVSMSGEGANGAKFSALASGALFAEGALKVDPKNYTIELPTTSAIEGTSTVTVIATSADGKKTAKATFKVTVEYKEPEPVKPGEDISGFIILTGATPRSDGTAWAQIFDNANRLRYTIEANRTGVKILKEEKLAGTLPWRKDRDHDYPAGVMVLLLSDEGSKTQRTFKVIAVDFDGLIVADMKPKASAAPSKGPGKGPGRGAFGRPPGGSQKQGHAEPLAAVGGNVAVAIAKPKLYRWTVGKSLKSLKEIPEEEAREILKMAETIGPVFDEVATGR